MAEEGLEIAYFEEFPQEEVIRFKGYDEGFRAYCECLGINESFIPSLYEDIAKTRISTLKPAEINSLLKEPSSAQCTRTSGQIQDYSLQR